MKTRILYITQSFPFPADSGAHIKTLSTLKALSQKFEVHFFCLAVKRPPVKDIIELRKIVDQVSFSVCPSIQSSLKTRPIWVLKNFLQGKPYLFFQYYHLKANLQIEAVIAQYKPQVIHIDHLSMAQFLPREKKQVWILESHNMESDLSEEYAKNSKNIFRSMFYWCETFFRKKLEDRFFPSFDHIFVLSTEELVKMRRIVPGKISIQKIWYKAIPLLLKKKASKEKKRNTLLFVGDFDWYPNQDGATWFVENVFPLLLHNNPKLELHIVGSGSGKILEKNTQCKQIFCHGYQKDLGEYFEKSMIFVAPIRIGSGIRIKILTAFQNSIPVVSTTKGLSGLEHIKNSCLVADDHGSFAHAVSQLLHEASLRAKITKNAKIYLKKEFPADSEKIFLREYENTIAAGFHSHRH